MESSALRLWSGLALAGAIAGFIGNGHFIREILFACNKVNELSKDYSREEAILYFTFFALFIVLHGARIFHIFHATARPPRIDGIDEAKLGETVDKVHSVTGIWVSKYFNSMNFAATDLVNTLPGLSPIFSLELYGTREDKTATTDAYRGAAHPGRPDWDKICQTAIDNAHTTNPEGESVGIFFCGSPASKYYPILF